jgi:hypothetical protein
MLESGGGRESREERAEPVVAFGKKESSDAGMRRRVRIRSVGGCWMVVIGGVRMLGEGEWVGGGLVDRSAIGGGTGTADRGKVG